LPPTRKLCATSATARPGPKSAPGGFVERQIELFTERAFCLWKLVPKPGGSLIGFCGLQPLPELKEIEIGWWLARARWGRGLATEAARVALRDGFERVGLRRIVSIAQPANTASIGIMRKLGMHFESITQPRGIPWRCTRALCGARPRRAVAALMPPQPAKKNYGAAISAGISRLACGDPSPVTKS
jgi:RimJ/RimL family protein N-acetyltransferase